ncbi:hypothetical protein ACNR9V_09920 [Parageobacillus thermoglucosidasius]|uniref:hypothetical protein n=1 Tax=Parageobacillus thermoglucosidasius TaxID=1426 RepID=UPI003B675888
MLKRGTVLLLWMKLDETGITMEGIFMEKTYLVNAVLIRLPVIFFPPACAKRMCTGWRWLRFLFYPENNPLTLYLV